MGRKLPLALAVSFAVYSAQALAVGMESPRLRSNLNQPLDARIGLTDTSGLDASLIKAGVADSAAFTRAGVDRSYVSDDIKVAVKQQGGRYYLQLSTNGAVREPYVDLLLDVEWPNGKLQRQVTLLFDPAGYSSQPSLVTPAGARSRPLATDDSSPTRSVVFRDNAQPSQASSRSASSSTPPSSIKVRNGDSLWTIARRVRPDASVSIRQAMLAIQEANPAAFPGGNINKLRAGVVLQVPDRSTMLGRSRTEADREVRQQYQQWVAGAQGKTVPAPASKKTAAASTSNEPSASAAPAATAAPSGPASAGADGKPRLTLLDEDGSKPKAAAASGQISAGSQQAIDELSDRLESLEDQLLTNQQRLDQLEQERDDLRSEVASLRNEVGELRASLAERTEQLETAKVLLAKQNRLLVNSGISPLALPESLIAAGVDLGQPRDGEGNLVLPKQPWPQATWQWVQDNLAIVGGAAGALLLLLLLLLRRRSGSGGDENMSFADAVRGNEEPDQDKPRVFSDTFAASTAAAAAGHKSSASEDANVAVRRGSGSLEPLSQPEAAAISEADIFIAYGRFDQAQALLEAGLVEDPARQDLRLKLMGVHGELGNAEALHHEGEQVLAAGNEEERFEAQALLDRYSVSSSALRAVAGGGASQVGRKVSYLSGVASQQAAAPRTPLESRDKTDDAAHGMADVSATGSDASLDDPEDSVGLSDSEQHAGDGVSEPLDERAPDQGVAFEPGLKGEDLEKAPVRESHFNSDNVIDYQAPELTLGDAGQADGEKGTDTAASKAADSALKGESVEFTSLREELDDNAAIESNAASQKPHGASSKSSAAVDGMDELPSLDSMTLEEVEVPRRDISEFEVEEVAFVSGDQDNAYPSVESAGFGAGAQDTKAFQQLEEARQLLVDGDDDQAAALLEPLATASDDMVREEALALMERFGLT
ncbi:MULTISPECIES: FimV/HubP family polar landmark protein [Cobetia]|uniref:type IV pilus assembly protein FimV n=1 Tax=Cobetia TaxID=204286 RepID=UPI001581C207|nr:MULTISPECIES: FimV/HubP family polar landmark protein [Cobetia]MDI4660638.1 LysM peptidoglycan-binding domain-containing protein [Cobetia sp. BMC6]MDL2190132.1 FimV/HubP family polar landmark protein [Cobetia sp. LC6]NUJ54727.1 LysM peptidoglycan-binding domain-containing protein [Cobetia marina]